MCLDGCYCLLLFCSSMECILLASECLRWQIIKMLKKNVNDWENGCNVWYDTKSKTTTKTKIKPEYNESRNDGGKSTLRLNSNYCWKEICIFLRGKSWTMRIVIRSYFHSRNRQRDIEVATTTCSTILHNFFFGYLSSNLLLILPLMHD